VPKLAKLPSDGVLVASLSFVTFVFVWFANIKGVGWSYD
jgi:hypothetical protein